MGICWNKQIAVYCSYLNMPGRKYFGACLEQLPEELKLGGGREEGGNGEFTLEALNRRIQLSRRTYKFPS